MQVASSHKGADLLDIESLGISPEGALKLGKEIQESSTNEMRKIEAKRLAKQRRAFDEERKSTKAASA